MECSLAIGSPSPNCAKGRINEWSLRFFHSLPRKPCYGRWISISNAVAGVGLATAVAQTMALQSNAPRTNAHEKTPAVTGVVHDHSQTCAARSIGQVPRVGLEPTTY